MITELATLNTPQLVDKVKDLLDNAYQLGLEECNGFFINLIFINLLIVCYLNHTSIANEMTRGRLLNILDSKTNN